MYIRSMTGAFVLSLAAVITVSAQGPQPKYETWGSVIVQIATLAREQKQPLGFVISKEKSCAVLPNTVQFDDKLKLEEALELLAKASGGSLTRESGVPIIEVDTPPARLKSALSYKFPLFPAMNGTTPYLSAILNGWLRSTLPGNHGFAVDIASSFDEREMHLSESRNLSISEIASKVAQLEMKSVWVASDSTKVNEAKDTDLSLDIYGYSYPPMANIAECSKMNGTF